jgi:hypothetical protein
MRENRTYGSEGGEGDEPFPTPTGAVVGCRHGAIGHEHEEMAAAFLDGALQFYARLRHGYPFQQLVEAG